MAHTWEPVDSLNSLAASNRPRARAAGRVVDDVRAGLVHGLGDDLGLGGLEPALEVGRLGDVGVEDADVRIHGLHARLEAGVEPPDEIDVHAADEADGAGRGFQRRGGAHQERALVLGEDQPGEVLGAVGGAVDDAEVGVGVVGRHLRDGLAEQEAHADHEVGPVGGELQHFGAVGAVGVRRRLGGRHAQLGRRAVQAGRRGVVERLVAATADVEHQRRGDVLGFRRRWGRLGGRIRRGLGRSVRRWWSGRLRAVVGSGCRSRRGGRRRLVVAAARCGHHHSGQQDRQQPGKSSSHVCCVSLRFSAQGAVSVPVCGGSRVPPPGKVARWRAVIRIGSRPTDEGRLPEVSAACGPYGEIRGARSGSESAGIACNRIPARRRSGRPAPPAAPRGGEADHGEQRAPQRRSDSGQDVRQRRRHHPGHLPLQRSLHRGLPQRPRHVRRPVHLGLRQGRQAQAGEALREGQDLAVERQRSALAPRRGSRHDLPGGRPAAADARGPRRRPVVAAAPLGRCGVGGVPHRGRRLAPQPVPARRAGRAAVHRQDRRDRAVDRRQVLRRHPGGGPRPATWRSSGATCAPS